MNQTIIFIALACLVAGSIISGFLYFRQKQYSGNVQYVLFALRSLGIGLMLFVLLSPLIPLNKKERLKPIIAVMVDNSLSMVSSTDSLYVQNELSEALQGELNVIDEADVQAFQFANGLETDEPKFQGQYTDLAEALKALKNKIDPNRLSGIVVVSDGIVNKGGNPLYELENTFTPIYSVGIGDTSKQKDIAIANVRSPSFVFRGDEVLVEATISASNLDGFKTSVSLKQNGNAVDEASFVSSSSDYAGIVQFRFTPKKAGTYAYDIAVPKVAGENNTRNNTYRFYLEVIENRKRIAIVSGAPSPDVAAVREALNSVDAYQANYHRLPTYAPSDEDELLILFIQPGFRAFNYKNLLAKYKGPIMLFIHPAVDGRVVADGFEGLSIINNGRSTRAKAIINQNFGLFKLSNETRQALAKMPDVEVTEGALQTAEPMEFLIQDRAGKKLAQFGNLANTRVALFTMANIWDWRVADYRNSGNFTHVDELIQASVQYLTADNNSQRLRLYYEPRIALGTTLKIRAEVYDASLQSTTEATLNIDLINTSNKAKQSFDFQKSTSDYSLTISGLKEGNYSLAATAKLGDEVLQAKGELLVEQAMLESINTRANFDLLSQMSNATGGKFYTKETLSNLGEDLASANVAKPIERIERSSMALIDLLTLLFIAVALLALEWLFRRYYGRI